MREKTQPLLIINTLFVTSQVLLCSGSAAAGRCDQGKGTERFWAARQTRHASPRPIPVGPAASPPTPARGTLRTRRRSGPRAGWDHRHPAGLQEPCPALFPQVSTSISLHHGNISPSSALSLTLLCASHTILKHQPSQLMEILILSVFSAEENSTVCWLQHLGDFAVGLCSTTPNKPATAPSHHPVAGEPQ